MDATASCPTDLRYSKLHFILKFAKKQKTKNKKQKTKNKKQITPTQKQILFFKLKLRPHQIL
jgi:hypothetical protein